MCQHPRVAKRNPVPHSRAYARTRAGQRGTRPAVSRGCRSGRVRPVAAAGALEDAERALCRRLDRQGGPAQRDDVELGDAGVVRSEVARHRRGTRGADPRAPRSGGRLHPVHDRSRGSGDRAQVHQAGRGRPRRADVERVRVSRRSGHRRTGARAVRSRTSNARCASRWRSATTRCSSARWSTPRS